LARRIIFFPVDLYESLFNRRQEFIPPKGLIYTGRRHFISIGDRMFGFFTKKYGVHPDYKILDIGCGIGRMARPFTKFLNGNGSYYGFDVVEAGINWCKEAYKHLPNFHFQHTPLYNDLYNLSTTDQPSDFSFPYADNFFDFSMVISVFTHMQEPDLQHYLKEIQRVLKPDKYCFCTFFIITEEMEKQMTSKQGNLFKYRSGNYFLHNEKVKDANVAYLYGAIQDMATAADLEIIHFFPGWWSGHKKEGHVDYQDVMVLRK
jgi:ubiquinone/menaquinone biosynthesis C-methylase UbiE